MRPRFSFRKLRFPHIVGSTFAIVYGRIHSRPTSPHAPLTATIAIANKAGIDFLSAEYAASRNTPLATAQVLAAQLQPATNLLSPSRWDDLDSARCGMLGEPRSDAARLPASVDQLALRSSSFWFLWRAWLVDLSYFKSRRDRSAETAEPSVLIGVTEASAPRKRVLVS